VKFYDEIRVLSKLFRFCHALYNTVLGKLNFKTKMKYILFIILNFATTLAFSQEESSISLYLGLQQTNTHIEKPSPYLKSTSRVGGLWGMAFRQRINRNFAMEIGYNNYKPTVIFDLSEYLIQKNEIDGFERLSSKITSINNFYFSPIWIVLKADKNKVNAAIKSRISISLIGSIIHSASSNPYSQRYTVFDEKDNMTLFSGTVSDQSYSIEKWRFSPQIELGFFLSKNFALDIRAGYIIGRNRIHDLEMTYSFKNETVSTGKVYVNGKTTFVQLGLKYYLNF
jgi:hypothetical protein